MGAFSVPAGSPCCFRPCRGPLGARSRGPAVGGRSRARRCRIGSRTLVQVGLVVLVEAPDVSPHGALPVHGIWLPVQTRLFQSRPGLRVGLGGYSPHTALFQDHEPVTRSRPEPLRHRSRRLSFGPGTTATGHRQGRPCTASTGSEAGRGIGQGQLAFGMDGGLFGF